MAQANVSQIPENAPALGRVRIAGRIELVRQNSGQEGKSYRTVLRLPAPDRFSSPATVEVRSIERLGQREDEVSVVCEVGGYPRSYKTSDGEKVNTAENVLKFVAFA